MYRAAAVGGVVQPRGAGHAAARLPRAQALVPAVALRAPAGGAPGARAQDGLDQDQAPAGRRAPPEEGDVLTSLVTRRSSVCHVRFERRGGVGKFTKYH